MGLFDGLIKKNWESDLITRAKKEGAAEGAQGRPAPNSTEPDEKETAYSAEALKVIIAANDRVTTKIRDLVPKTAAAEQELNTIQPKFDSRPSLEVVRNDSLAEFHQRRHQLIKHYYDSLDTQGSYNEFRVKHGISIPPNHPENPIDKLADLLVLLVIEAALNSVFWHGSENVGTWLSGIFYGAASATITICVGLAAGLGFRWKNRTETWSTPVALASLAIGIFVIFWISAWVSTQRSLTKFGDAFVELSSIFANLENMALFFCGLFFGLYAIKKGYSDIYGTVPGYREMSEHYKAADHSVQETTKEIRAATQAVFDKATGNCNSIIYTFKNLADKFAYISAECSAVRQDFALTKDQVLASLKTIIGIYRATNAAVKPTGIDSPGYFSEEVTIDAEINSQVDILAHKASELEIQRKKLSESILQQVAAENNSLLEERGRVLNEELQELFAESMETAKKQFIDNIATAKPFERFDNV